MFEFFRQTFGTTGFMPHGHCYLWTPALLWTQVISNSLIALAYFMIAGGLGVMTRQIDDMPFGTMYWAFAAFITACGLTHAFDVVVIWAPRYWIDAGLRTVTAVVSVGTALLLIPRIPKAVTLIRGARSAAEKGVQLESVVEDLEKLYDLENLYEQTKELEERKTEFFANVSHELRTPLTLIRGRAEELAEADISSETREAADSILDQTDLLMKHVEDLLDIACFEVDEFKLDESTFDFGRLVRCVADNFDGLADDCDITYAVEGPESLGVEMDRERLENVLMNLLSNAFKFTPDGGTIRVVYDQVETDDGAHVELAVHDSGPGVAADRREAIFERFHQEDVEQTDEYGGTGLGLVIVRNIVKLHEGEVFVEEAPEGGARFVVQLPTSTNSSGASAGDEETDATGEPADTGGAPTREGLVDRITELRRSKHRRRPDHEESSPGDVTPEQEKNRTVPDPEQVEDVATNVTDPPRPTRVLVVEDDPSMSDYVCEVLADDFDPVPVADGKEALEVVNPQPIDLVVTDIMMPEMDGVELIERLNAESSTSDIPVLVLTAKETRELRAKLLRKGAADFISKPFSREELIARVSNLDVIQRTRRLLQRELASRRQDIAKLASELSEKTSVLEDLALYDQLTDLPNRTLFQDRLEHAIQRARRRDSAFGVAFIDLDDFKAVNDSLGHAAGDQLMRQVARRLEETFRAEDTVARLGGDEFVVLTEAVDRRSQLEGLGERLREQFQPAFTLDERGVELSISTGFAFVPPGVIDEVGLEICAESLLQVADRAMYEAKHLPGSSWQILEPSPDQTPSQQIQRRTRIREGLEAGEFLPHYQPLYDLETRTVTGLELLARWRHPDHGMVSPGKFIPVAEQSDLICRLGEELAECTCREFGQNPELLDPDAPLQLFVNLSPRQLEDVRTIDSLLAIFESQLPPGVDVSFEVTEGQLLEHGSHVFELRNRGYRVVIDDFGTGYSSLTRIKELPVDGLKLDMEFVHGITESTVDEAIARTIIELGETLELPVVAEGIENETQLEHLLDAGCILGQGYLLARPQPLEAFRDELAEVTAVSTGK